jgi:hypothetical protein
MAMRTRSRTVSLLPLGSRAMVSLREITSRETTGRRFSSLGAAIGRHAHVLPLCTGMPGSRVTSMCSSHPANSNPQIKTAAAKSGDFPMPFVKFFIRPSSKTDTVSYALNTAWLEELRRKESSWKASDSL